MKYSRFAFLGPHYPYALEHRFERILARIDSLWPSAALDDYFADLQADGNGFPPEVHAELLRLREHHRRERAQAAERKSQALREMDRRGMAANVETFAHAFATGNSDTLQLLAHAQFDFPPLDAGEPLLIAALRRGYPKVALVLLTLPSTDVNQRNALGLTPLLLCCGKAGPGDSAVAEALIRRGARLDERDPLGHTALLLALINGMASTAELLIRHGARVDVATARGESALALARQSPSADAARLVKLIEARRRRP